MTMLTFRGRCHTCGHDHDADDQRLRDILDIVVGHPERPAYVPLSQAERRAIPVAIPRDGSDADFADALVIATESAVLRRAGVR